MVTIVNKYTGEQICKYSNAIQEFADKDCFIANVKGSNAFRARFSAIVDYFIPLGHSVQCLLKDRYAILEKLTEEDKRYW